MTHIPDAAVQAAKKAVFERCKKTYLTDDQMFAALTAAYPHLPLGYEVKKLEWVPRVDGGFTCIDDNEYSIGFWEDEKLYVGSYTTMERSKNADDIKGALQKKFERRVCECLVPLSITKSSGCVFNDLGINKPDEVLDDASIKAKVSEIGNQIHNLGCEHQNNEALSDRLKELRDQLWDQLWDISKNCTKSVDVAAVTKPVTNIESRTPKEVFDIMCDRIRAVPDMPELVRYEPNRKTYPYFKMEEDELGEYVRYNQAAAMIATKEKEIQELKEKLGVVSTERHEDAEYIRHLQDKLAQIKAQVPVAWLEQNPETKEYEIYSSQPFGTYQGMKLYAAPVDQTAEIERLRGALASAAEVLDIIFCTSRVTETRAVDDQFDLVVAIAGRGGSKAHAALSGKEPT